MSILRRILFALVIFLAVPAAQAQTATTTDKSFRISDPGPVRNLDEYTQALQKADLDRYRFKAKSNIIHFESGLEVEIYSAEWCFLHGIPVKSDRIRVDSQNYDDGVFALAPNGVLVEKKNYQYKSSH